MKKLALIFSVLLVMCTLLVMNTAWSSDRSGRGHEPGGLRRTDGSPVSTLININNLAGWVRNDGWSARNPSTGNAGVYFPRGTSTAIYQDGIVWGGNVNDGGSQILRVGGQTYNIGTVPGRIISKGVAANPNDPDVRVYRIRRDYATADLRQDASELLGKSLSAVTDGDIATIRAQYQTDWNQWPGGQGAPYYDTNGDGVFTAGVDEPGVADADQVIWFVCNDLDAGKTNALYGSNPIGFELQVTLWGYLRSDPLANVYFKKFTFIYKGTSATTANASISDMYVGQWSDPDMGDSGDDFSGSDVAKSLVYVYNGHSVDNEYAKYGLAPPAIGYDFFQGPLVHTGNLADTSAIFGLKKKGPGYVNLPMTAAFYFAAGGRYSDPPFTREGTTQWYNLLRGLTPISGAPFVYPGIAGATTYWLDGDPVAHTGRLDGTVDNPGDRRIGACSGPFTMALGDTQEIVVAVVGGIAGDYLTSITIMKNNDVAAQKAYDDLFDLPKAPPSPKVNAVTLDKQIVLDWGSDLNAVNATESFSKKGYTFQGYNVYQLGTSSTSIDLAGDKRLLDTRSDVKILATYDVPGDAVRTIQDNVFDVTLNTNVQIIKQRGTDSGIKRQLVINTDRIRSAPLVNGQRYFFAVTAYGYSPDPTALTHSLESSLQLITAIPNAPAPGTRLAARYGDTITVVNSNPGKKSDGIITANVIDPTKLTGKSYEVRFKTVPTVFVVPQDTAHETDPFLNWFVIRGGTDTLFRGLNQGATAFIDPFGTAGNPFEYPILDGMFITVSGPAPLLNDARTGWTGTRWWTGAGRFTLGGVGADVLRDEATTAFDATNYLGAVGSTLDPSQYVDIEFRFGAGGTLTQKAYRYRRNGSPNTYRFQDYVDVPFQVWDISNPAAPRQLNCGWRDQDADGHYTLGNAAAGPNTEIIFVAKSTYDGATAHTYGTTVGSDANNIPTGDFMYLAEWISRNGLNSDITATTIHISPNYVNSPADIFSFNAPAAPAYDAKTARADVSAVNVFPNPYYGFNSKETTRSVRYVTFSHLPARAEIRIFNLAGALVRAYDETALAPQQRFGQSLQFQNWDLNNQQGLPVASGIYIAFIKMKDASGADLGTKTLKFIIIQEQQYLDNF